MSTATPPAAAAAQGRVLPPQVKLGLLDCDATLPSGKSTLERFKLSRPGGDGPLVLLFANQARRRCNAV